MWVSGCIPQYTFTGSFVTAPDLRLRSGVASRKHGQWDASIPQLAHELNAGYFPWPSRLYILAVAKPITVRFVNGMRYVLQPGLMLRLYVPSLKLFYITAADETSFTYEYWSAT